MKEKKTDTPVKGFPEKQKHAPFLRLIAIFVVIR